ncbi:hypothetical protein LguiA_021787 [Lonicera macranthoides]
MSNALKLNVSLHVPGYPNVPTYKRRSVRLDGRGDGYIFEDYKHRSGLIRAILNLSLSIFFK